SAIASMTSSVNEAGCGPQFPLSLSIIWRMLDDLGIRPRRCSHSVPATLLLQPRRPLTLGLLPRCRLADGLFLFLEATEQYRKCRCYYSRLRLRPSRSNSTHASLATSKERFPVPPKAQPALHHYEATG